MFRINKSRNATLFLCFCYSVKCYCCFTRGFWAVDFNNTTTRETQLETEGLVHTERTAGRYVTEDTALIEQLRADTARTLASDFLEKMRGIGYSPAQTAALLEHWDAKEDRNE